MNSFVAYGRLTDDVNLTYTASAMAVGRFSLAVNRTYQKGDIKADFFNMTAFGKTAETISNYFHRGSRIVVHCHAQQDNYTKQDGTKVNTVSFIVDSFSFVDTRAEGGITQNQNIQPTPSTMSANSDEWMNIPDGVDESLPFD